MRVMSESAGWTARPLSAMGSPRCTPDAETDGHTPTKSSAKDRKEMDTWGGVYMCNIRRGEGCQCNNT